MRPVQTKLTRNNNPDDLALALDEAMSSISSAMESIMGYEELSDFFNALADVYDDMKPEHEMFELKAGAEYTNEIALLTADYYRSVI